MGSIPVKAAAIHGVTRVENTRHMSNQEKHVIECAVELPNATVCTPPVVATAASVTTRGLCAVVTYGFHYKLKRRIGCKDDGKGTVAVGSTVSYDKMRGLVGNL